MDAPIPQRAIALVAGASWLLPMAGLTLVGLSQRGAALLPWSSSGLVLVALATAVPGLALGVAAWLGSPGQRTRRRAAAGVVTSAVVLLVTGIGSVSGSVSGQRAQRELRVATEAAVRDFPGWNGGAVIDGASVYALEVDGRSELARILLRPYDQTFKVILVGVDNRSGSGELVLDLDGVRARRGDGGEPDALGLTRDERLAHAAEAADPLVMAQADAVRVPAGQRADGAQALFAPGTSFQDVRSIEVRVNGAMRLLRGRYFTLDDKRAIDQARQN